MYKALFILVIVGYFSLHALAGIAVDAVEEAKTDRISMINKAINN
jgi:hypothetical protein